MIFLLVGLSFLLSLPRRVKDRLPTGRLTYARWLGRGGAPLDLTLGSQLAFERGRGVRSVPSAPAAEPVGGAAACAVVTAAALYVGGIDRLCTEPAGRRGWPRGRNRGEHQLRSRELHRRPGRP